MKAQRKKSVFGIGFAVFVPGQQNVGRPFVAFFYQLGCENDDTLANCVGKVVGIAFVVAIGRKFLLPKHNFY